jgi:hypothetical protein
MYHMFFSFFFFNFGERVQAGRRDLEFSGYKQSRELIGMGNYGAHSLHYNILAQSVHIRRLTVICEYSPAADKKREPHDY